jgi:hypothetical protein
MTPIKIGFVLLSNSRAPVASTRISALNMFPFLQRANFDPIIVFEPPEATETPNLAGLARRVLAAGCEIVVFQKVHGPNAEAVARELSLAGVTTVYSVCDLVNAGMAQATNVTIVVTDYLRSLYPPHLQSRIRVVHDGIERPEARKTEWRRDRGSRSFPLRAILVTGSDLHELPVIADPPEWLVTDIVGLYAPSARPLRRLREMRWKLKTRQTAAERLAYLRFLANRRIRRIAWNPVDVYEVMRRADIGIIPIETSAAPEPGENAPRWRVKSENRLTMKMCVGLPVIATPIPAYEGVIEHGQNGFFARAREEWFQVLEQLREPRRRRDLGERAREAVVSRYSMEEQARKLIDVLLELYPTLNCHRENAQP